jgi:2,4-dienoyl-CoA reductase-like NADH-dependent reductase (Old Yellow Enzyme family)
MNQETIKHIHTRYMQGVGLTCLSRVYHEPITTIFHEIQNYQNKLDSGTNKILTKTNHKRNRKATVRKKHTGKQARGARSAQGKNTTT